MTELTRRVTVLERHLNDLRGELGTLADQQPAVPLEPIQRCERELSRALRALRNHLDGNAEGAQARVLIVDDDPGVRSTVRRLLTNNGYAVLEAASGLEALDLTESGCAALRLILTDMVMPGMSGQEFVEQVRPRCPDIPVLYMTGYRRDGVESGSYILKPFTPELLLDRVAAMLGFADEIAPCVTG